MGGHELEKAARARSHRTFKSEGRSHNLILSIMGSH